jgi:hypothetical protein
VLVTQSGEAKEGRIRRHFSDEDIFSPSFQPVTKSIIEEIGDDLGTREKRACKSSKS